MRLTKDNASTSPAPSKGYALYWSDDLAGFGLRVSSQGKRCFIAQGRVKGTTKERRVTLGNVQILDYSTAVRMGRQALAAFLQGIDASMHTQFTFAQKPVPDVAPWAKS